LISDTLAGDAAIEAPFIFKKDAWYYLFVSFDYCCRGEKSTYKMVVGRSERIEGPYLDKVGAPMTRGGGSVVLEGDKNWNRVGHNAVVSFDGVDYLVFHGYDARDKGKFKLRIEKLIWTGGWPAVLR
jgi:arabinan endo-1,5-alpha-L-arabinosidase